VGGILAAVEEEGKDALEKLGEGEVAELVRRRWLQVRGILGEARTTLED
jgi:archaellum component FlaD/FlaE